MARWGTAEIRELRQLREENLTLKRLVADLSLDKTMLPDVTSKNGSADAPARCLAVSAQGQPDQRATRMSGDRRHNRSTVQYKSVKTDVPALRARINEIAATRVRYAYLRIHVLMRREGWLVNRSVSTASIAKKAYQCGLKRHVDGSRLLLRQHANSTKRDFQSLRVSGCEWPPLDCRDDFAGISENKMSAYPMTRSSATRAAATRRPSSRSGKSRSTLPRPRSPCRPEEPTKSFDR